MFARADMDAAIKRSILPRLRQMGFKGTLPHLYRLRNGACDYLTFQFLSAGGAFTVELARGNQDGLMFHGRHIPVAKVSTRYLHPRHRLGAPLSGGDHWYRFESVEPEAVAAKVLKDLGDPAVWQLVDSFPLPTGTAQPPA
jgi:hypothetical protein